MNELLKDIQPVSDEEMKEVMANGERITVKDNDLEITAYIYKDRIYVHDVKHVT